MSKTPKSIQRLPYFIELSIWSSDFCETRLTSDESLRQAVTNGMFANGLPLDYVEFYLEHGRCAHCNATISSDFGKCRCGKPRGKIRHLDIKYPTHLYQSHYLKLFNRELGRVRAAKRAQMIQDNGGSFDKKHVGGMYKAQRGLCYFCARKIEIGSKSMHVDHYQSLADGGRNDLSNMVLTCPKCNMLKNATHGDRFDLHSRKTRSPELNEILKVIRRDLNAYKKSVEADSSSL